MTTARIRIGLAISAVAVTVLALASLRATSPSGAGIVSAGLLLMVAPGACVYLLFDRRPHGLEIAACALLLSPVVVASIAALLVALGVGIATVPAAVCVLCGVLAVATVYAAGTDVQESGRRNWIALGALTIGLCVLCGYLPYTEEWWRIRSDGWFHRGVIAQIADFGFPPGDPYFAGVELQYMWFYHVWNLVTSQAMNLRPQWTMAFFNTLSLAGLVVGAYLFASVFHRRLSNRLWSAAMVPLGLSAAFWVFVPIRLGRAFTGEVRGWAEVKRQLALSPFDIDRAYDLMRIYFNPEFFLDKYIVPTAFSLGMSLYVLVWFAASAYLRTPRRSLLVVIVIATAGMLGFHTLVGVVSLVGLIGGVGLLWVLRRRVSSFSGRPVLAVAGSALVAAVTMIPYVYSITHLKEPNRVFPIGISFEKTAGVMIGCALAGVLALFQRRFFRNSEMANRYVVLATISVALFCLIAVLPGANEYDKPSYFIFIPLAVVAAWTLADFTNRRTGGVRVLSVALTALVCFGPVNILGFAGSYATPVPVVISSAENRLAEWVRSHTSRDAVFIDEDNRVFLLTEGPRRYYYGRHAYARHWGYRIDDMALRYHVRTTLLSATRPLDANTLEALGAFPWDVFVVVRSDSAGANVDRYPEFFQTVYAEDGITLARVDRTACRVGAASGGFPRISVSDIIDASGLQSAEWSIRR